MFLLVGLDGGACGERVVLLSDCGDFVIKSYRTYRSISFTYPRICFRYAYREHILNHIQCAKVASISLAYPEHIGRVGAYRSISEHILSMSKHIGAYRSASEHVGAYPSISQAYQEHVANISQRYRRHIADISQTYRRYIVRVHAHFAFVEGGRHFSSPKLLPNFCSRRRGVPAPNEI